MNHSTVRLAILSTVTLTDCQEQEPSGSSIFESVQKLGLKLDARRMPVDIIVVVDSAEKRPAEN